MKEIAIIEGRPVAASGGGATSIAGEIQRGLNTVTFDSLGVQIESDITGQLVRLLTGGRLHVRAATRAKVAGDIRTVVKVYSPGETLLQTIVGIPVQGGNSADGHTAARSDADAVTDILPPGSALRVYTATDGAMSDLDLAEEVDDNYDEIFAQLIIERVA